MALTNNCDLFGSMHETAFNTVVTQLQLQRPSLFNYGTISFVLDPSLFCNKKMIDNIDRDVINFSNPIATQLGLLGIPGYGGTEGLEFCLQFAELSIDFHPGNVHSLPPELNPPLKEQRFSLKGRMCAGLACPGDILKKIRTPKESYYPKVNYDDDIVAQPNKPTENERADPKIPDFNPNNPTNPLPFDPKNILCFCLDLYGVFHIEREGSILDPILSLKLDNLELVDISPEALENSAECYLKTMLILSLLPKIRIAMIAFVFNIAEVLTIHPTPLSTQVPNNPAIEKDQINIFVSITI